MSKFADNLEYLAEQAAEYIRYLEQEVSTLKEEKNYLLRRAGENIAEIEQYKSALIAYASEFPNDEEGLPDVGNIHKNIRTLKSQKSDLLTVLKEVDLFLHHCWCAVHMNEYSFEKLNHHMEMTSSIMNKIKG